MHMKEPIANLLFIQAIKFLITFYEKMQHSCKKSACKTRSLVA